MKLPKGTIKSMAWARSQIRRRIARHQQVMHDAIEQASIELLFLVWHTGGYPGHLSMKAWNQENTKEVSDYEAPQVYMTQNFDSSGKILPVPVRRLVPQRKRIGRPMPFSQLGAKMEALCLGWERDE